MRYLKRTLTYLIVLVFALGSISSGILAEGGFNMQCVSCLKKQINASN